jgi:TniQ
MSTWTPQRIPITLEPVIGEALDSWIEAYARRLNTCSRSLLNHLGLSGSQPRHMVMLLTDTERDTLAEATGLSQPHLDAMTLERFDGIAVTLNRDRRISEHPPAWRRHSGSRYCPTCLADDGRWRLAWRLPWAFACPNHHRLLADTCPACHRHTHPDRPGYHDQLTIPGTCTAPADPGYRSIHKPPCGHRLADVTTTLIPADGLVIHAYDRIHRLINDGASHGDPHHHLRRQLEDLFVLAYRALTALATGTGHIPDAVEQILDECGGVTPEPYTSFRPLHAHTLAAASAMAVIAATDDQTGTALLDWIVHHDHRLAHPEINILLRSWNHCSPSLTTRVVALFDDRLRIQQRLAYATATPSPRLIQPDPSRPAQRAGCLPALLWPDWTMRMIPASDAYNRSDSTRAALAAAALIPGNRLTYQQAVDLLGGYTTTAAIRGLLDNLAPEHREATITLLVHLADTLDQGSAPINYHRRRALFNTTGVGRPAYTALAARCNWHPPSPLQLRILDRHLVTLLTGAAGDTRIGPTRWNAANAFNPLLVCLPTLVRGFVHDQAHELLTTHNIDEPLTWHPPITPDAPWPGIDPDRVDSHDVANAFTRYATTRNPLGRLHDATGMSAIHLRLYIETLTLDMPESLWNHLATDPSGDLLDPARLRHLYNNEQLALRDIASRSLTTETTVRQTLTTTGTQLEANRPYRVLITREWFEQHYLNTNKSVRQAAREAGCSPTTLRLRAREHDIPFGITASPANPFASWLPYYMPPPTVIAACAGRRGIEYVRQVLTMPPYRTQRAAAAALGIHEVVLMRHRQHVEHAAGIRIFRPASTLLIPTPEGEQFLHDAAKALRRLDKLDHASTPPIQR